MDTAKAQAQQDLRNRRCLPFRGEDERQRGSRPAPAPPRWSSATCRGGGCGAVVGRTLKLPAADFPGRYLGGTSTDAPTSRPVLFMTEPFLRLRRPCISVLLSLRGSLPLRLQALVAGQCAY